MRNGKNERGQVLVLAVLMLGALLGFSAIALDGGNIYADRRSAQAAADSGSMAGALAIARGWGSSQVSKQALFRTAANGYANDANTTVTVRRPPVSPHPYAGNWNYVHVTITHRLDTILAHLFFGGAFRHTVESTAHASINETLAPGYAVYADNPTACSGVELSGSGTTVVTGGGSILSNSSASCACAVRGAAGFATGGGTATVVDPTGRAGIFSVGCWETGSGGSSFTYNLPGGGDPVPGAGQEYVDPPPLPNCSALPDMTGLGDQVFNGGTPAMLPGRYDSIATRSNAELTLTPGIYCIEGTLDAGGGEAISVGANSLIEGADVFIYLTDTAGGIQALGDGTTILAAGDPSGPSVPVLVDASGEDWRGMVFYLHPNNTNLIDLRGGAGTTYTGTIYAPGARCEMHGDTESIAFNTQMICDTILMTGSGTLSINFDPARLYKRKDMVELTH